MTRTSRSLSILVLALVAAPAVLMAQGTTTSALTGLVRDPAGKPLAGALVRISSSAMIGGEKSVRTSENGSYRFPMLVPGLYKITVASQGHSSLSGLEILELGQTSTVNWKFQPVASATVEVVSGAGIGMETATTGVSQNFASETIASLPATRTLSDILNMTPGINGSNAWGGSGSGSNAYLMDGINVGDTSGGTQWIYANMDWFDEVQVGGLGAAAEFGGFSGGFINTVVKRGGNELSGVFSSFYDSTKWQAKSSNKDWNWTQADREVPDAKNYDIRMSVGGPILKDKLWYFLSAQKEQNEMTYTGTLPTGPLPTKKINSLRVLGKLTYQVLPTATLEGMFEYDNRNIDHKYVNQTWGLYDAAAGGEQTSPSRYYSLTWTQTLGANLVLTLKGNGYNGGYDILPTHGDVNCLDIDADKFFNNLDIAERNKRGRTSFSATLDYFKSGLFSASDNHAFRIGIEREKGFSESVASNPGGYVLTADTGDLVGGVQEYLPYGAYTIGVEDVKVHSNKTILFAQDTWTLNDRVILRPGLRFEQDTMNPYGGSNLWNTKTVAPRIGLTINLTRDQKHVLKTHWGRFYDGIETSYISRSIPGATAPVTRWWWNDGAFTDLGNPPKPADLEFRDEKSSFTHLDPNAKLPYANETMVSYEAKLGSKWTASLTWVYRKWQDMLTRVDRAQTIDEGYRIWDPVAHGWVNLVDVTNPGDEDWYVTNDNRAKRAYWGWTLAADRKLADGWSLTASYTLARTYGNVSSLRGGASTFENPNNQINADGRLAGYNDDEVKLRGTYEIPVTKTRFSCNFTYLSGQRWTRTMSVKDTKSSGAWMYWSGTLFAEPRGSEALPARKLLDVRVSQSVSITNQVSAEFFLDVFNVMNNCSTVELNTRGNTNQLVNKVDEGVYSDYKKPTFQDTARSLRLGLRLKF